MTKKDICGVEVAVMLAHNRILILHHIPRGSITNGISDCKTPNVYIDVKVFSTLYSIMNSLFRHFLLHLCFWGR